MMAEKSLDKISHSLGINRKTTFDWCHKILSSLDQDEGKEFSGIKKVRKPSLSVLTKATGIWDLKACKRGSGHGDWGISKNKAIFIVTANRKNDLKHDVLRLQKAGKKGDRKESSQPHSTGHHTLYRQSHELQGVCDGQQVDTHAPKN